MKSVMLLVLVCSMIGFPAKAVNPTISVRVDVKSNENEGLMEAYLERELRKIDGVKIREFAEWEIHIVSGRLTDGLYARTTSIVRNRYIRSYLNPKLDQKTQDALAIIPECYGTHIQTGYDLEKMSKHLAVSIEGYLLRS